MSDISVGMLSSTPDNGYTSASLQNLDKDTFLQLLVAQMRYQNPLSPVDSNEYLAQAAQYASVEQLENMAQSQAELRSMQMVTIATGLVGQEVTAVDPFSGQEMTGMVDVVKFGAEPLLVVNGVEVPLSSVLSVREGAEEPSTSRPPETAAVQPDVIDVVESAPLPGDETPVAVEVPEAENAGDQPPLTEPETPGEPVGIEPEPDPQIAA